MNDFREDKSEDVDFLSSSRALRIHFEKMLADFTNFDSDFIAPFIDDWLAAIGVFR